MSTNTLFNMALPFQGPPLDRVIVTHFTQQILSLSDETESAIEVVGNHIAAVAMVQGQNALDIYDIIFPYFRD